MTVFDSHLDLAYLAVNGRDMMHADPLASGGPDQPGCVTLPSLREGNVRFALGTIFTEVGGKGPESYPPGDSPEAIERAFAVGRAQLEVYRTWRDRGLIAMDLRESLRVEAGTGAIRGGMGVAEVVPPSLRERIDKATGPRQPALRIGVLIEGADVIKTPSQLEWWASQGVVAIGLCWAKDSRYATGNAIDPATNRVGLTPAGRELIKEMDRLGVVPDLAHLSDRACDELLEATSKPVIASHSNCRAIVGSEPQVASPTAPNLQRHLRDDTIREIARRGGVIGINLLSQFILPGGRRDRRATVDETIAHIERVCELTNSRRHVGLGSDADGGITRERLPLGIDLPRDYTRLLDGLARRGWSEDDVRGFACENWCRFWADRG